MKNERYRILVADDEQVVRELFERFLTREGYEVSSAVDGIDALDKIRKTPYDMLILDLRMPRMDGIEVLDRVRGLDKSIIIIAITGFAPTTVAKEAIRKGCLGCIAKPFNIESMKFVIRQAFETDAASRA
jgi:CheY-like chemotaxis protein